MLARWEPDTNIIESSPGVAALNILFARGRRHATL